MVLGLLLPGGAKAGEAPLLLEGPAYRAPWQRDARWTPGDWSGFSTLARLASPPPPEQGVEVETALPITGDPEKGRALVVDGRHGIGCVSCHIVGSPEQAKGNERPGNLGPDLSEMAGFAREDGYLFNYIHDGRTYNGDTSMPPWGAHGLLTEAEIRDIVAYLETLATPAAFAEPADDPFRRKVVADLRDNLDPAVNPAVAEIGRGAALYGRAPAGKRSCAACHGRAEEAFAAWAAHMPRWEPRLGKVLGVEEFLYRHAAATTGDRLYMEEPENTALAIYLRYVANGQPIAVDLASAETVAALQRGEELAYRKIGQLNFACVDCHSPARGASSWLGDRLLSEMRGQLMAYPAWRADAREVSTVRRRFQACNNLGRATELPPDAPEYGELELYLAAENAGLPLNVPGIRF
jgi:sulfur-oxidizing protein SoxA